MFQKLGVQVLPVVELGKAGALSVTGDFQLYGCCKHDSAKRCVVVDLIILRQLMAVVCSNDVFRDHAC